MSADYSSTPANDDRKKRLGLFEAFGVELEYMIVDRHTFDVRPVTDQLIKAECGRIESELELGRISWSNELALHVVELKTTAPEPDLRHLAEVFQQHIRRINARLRQFHLPAQLMPSAMHPWMDPYREMELWPHEHNAIYAAFNEIFDCRGHGWANLQSVHLNLPFDGDDQFGRLHAAIRLVLPLLPGLAASSPAMNGRMTGLLDNRLQVYQGNSARVPSLAGKVIPEAIFTEEQYRLQIFQRMYDDIAPLDPAGVLQDEFLNARGAIARFGRGSIEIRVIDIQECPTADLAVLQATVAVIKALCQEEWSRSEDQRKIGVEPLYEILSAAIRDADQALVDNTEYLKLFGYHGSTAVSVQQLWRHLVSQSKPQLDRACGAALDLILTRGPLGRRLQERTLRLGEDRGTMQRFCRDLCECLEQGVMFQP